MMLYMFIIYKWLSWTCQRIWTAFVLSVSCRNSCVCFLKNYYAGWINWRTSCRSGTHNHILAKSWKVSCYSSKFTIFQSGMSYNIHSFSSYLHLAEVFLSNLPNLKFSFWRSHQVGWTTIKLALVVTNEMNLTMWTSELCRKFIVAS